MTKEPTLENTIIRNPITHALRTLAASAIAVMPMAQAQQPPVSEPQHNGAPVYDLANKPLAEAYAQDPNFCPPDMVENIMTIGGKQGIELLDSYLGDDTKKAIFGTNSLSELDVDTIGINLAGSEIYLVSADREIMGRVALGQNIGESFQMVANGPEFYVMINPQGQTSELSSASNENGLVPALSAHYGELRDGLCALMDYAIEQGGSRTIVGGPEGFSPGSSADRDADDLEDVLRSAGFAVPSGPITDAPGYGIGSSLTGHAVSGEFSIDDVLAGLPIGDIEGYGISFEPGRAAVRHDRGVYTIVAALDETAGTQEIAKLILRTSEGTYGFPITANAQQAADEYSVKLGTPEANRELNEAGIDLADNWKLSTFALENEGYEVERSFNDASEAGASESRRGYNEIVYDPQSGVVFGTYDIGTARFTPVAGLSPLERAIHNSNNAQVVGLDIAYNDSHAVRIGTYDPNE